MDEKTKILVYSVLEDFISLISSRNLLGMSLKFGISSAIFEEIEEVLDGYFTSSVILSLPPLNIAFSSASGSRVPFELYEMNDPLRWGVECALWANGKRSEPILHAEVEIIEGEVKLVYKYIGS